MISIKNNYSILAKALEDVVIPDILEESLLDDAEADHVFSKKFEKKMSKLIRRREKTYYPLIRTPLRFAATISIIIILMTGATVAACKPLRDWVINLIVTYYEDEASVNFTYSGIDDISQIEIMTPDYIPKGFKLAESTASKYRHMIFFTNNNNQIITYSQSRAFESTVFDAQLNSDEIIKINGQDAYLTINNDTVNLVWCDSGYCYRISGYLCRSDIIRMANSLKIDKNLPN